MAKVADELKPCPFCGGETIIMMGVLGSTRKFEGCADCGARGPLNSKGWNTRADADLIDELAGAGKALHLQALQSSLNDPSNEWGTEAIERMSAALARAKGESDG